MTINAHMTKEQKAIIEAMEYALERVKGLWGQGKVPVGKLGDKLAGPPVFRNVPEGVDPIDYTVGLVKQIRRGCNAFMSLVGSLPNGVVLSPAQFGLFNTLFLHHLSKTAVVLPPTSKGDKRSKLERLKPVDIEKELAHYWAIHSNTDNQHVHWGYCMVHPRYKRIVIINDGRYQIAVIHALYEALRDLGVKIENPYSLGTCKGRRIVALATHLKKDGSLKSKQELKAEGLFEKAVETVKGAFGAALAKFGIRKTTELESPPAKLSKAEAIRHQISVVEKLRAWFPKGPGHLDSKEPKVNKEQLDKWLRERNAGLKACDKGGMAFSVDGLHAPACECDKRWKRPLVEILCGLEKEWSLGKNEKEQSRFVREERQAMFKRACARHERTASATVMCGFLDAVPWKQVSVDVQTFDNEIVGLGVLENTSSLGYDRPPVLLDLADITRHDRFPIGIVLVTPVLPFPQLPLTLHGIPEGEIERLRTELDPALVVQTGKDEFSAMLIIESLPEGRWQTHNARSRLAHELCEEYKCEFGGTWGVPIPGLPLFPEPHVAKLVGKPITHTSVRVQSRLVETWERLKTEEQAWWKNIPRATANRLATSITHELSSATVEMKEVLPSAMAEAARLWEPAQPLQSITHVAKEAPPHKQPVKGAPEKPALVRTMTAQNTVVQATNEVRKDSPTISRVPVQAAPTPAPKRVEEPAKPKADICPFAPYTRDRNAWQLQRDTENRKRLKARKREQELAEKLAQEKEASDPILER